MRQVIEVVGTHERTTRAGVKYYITEVILDDGEEAEFYGKDIKVNDEVERFYHEAWDRVKVQKKKLSPEKEESS